MAIAAPSLLFASLYYEDKLNVKGHIFSCPYSVFSNYKIFSKKCKKTLAFFKTLCYYI